MDKNINNEKNKQQLKNKQKVSFCKIDEKGNFDEVYGYFEKSNAEEFFQNLSKEKLDNIKRK